jgi:hypothetical protein
VEVFVFIWLLFAAIATLVGASKGEGVSGFFIGLLLGPIGVLWIFFAQVSREVNEKAERASQDIAPEPLSEPTAAPPQADAGRRAAAEPPPPEREPEDGGAKSEDGKAANREDGDRFPGYFFACLLFLGLMAAAETYPTQEFWFFVVSAYLFAIPIFLHMLYIGVVRQTRDMSVLSPTGRFYRIFKGRWLRAFFSWLYAVSTSFVLLIQCRGYNASEWFAFFLVIPAFWGCFRVIRRLLFREYRPFFLQTETLRWTKWFCPAVMVLVFFGFVYLFGDQAGNPPGSLSESIDASLREVQGGGGGALVSYLTRWAAYIDGVTEYLLRNLGQIDAVWARALGVFAWYYFVFLNACIMISCFLVPRREYRRLFVPLTDADVPPKPSAGNIGMASGFFVILTLFIYVWGFAQAEQSARKTLGNPSSPWAGPEILTPKLERIEDEFYRPGTIEKLQTAKFDALRKLQASIAQLEMEADRAFDKVEANIDGYLDWYYSLPAEYTRIAKMMVGELESYMLEKLEEKLKAGAPFRKFKIALNEAFAASEAANKAYREAARKILDENRVESPGAGFRLAREEAMADLMDFKIHKDFITFKTRMAASGAAGGLAAGGMATTFIVKKIVAKMAGKNAIKLAAKAVVKVLATKTAGSAGGAGAGAATGAAIGSAIPGVGTAVGAVVGGVVGGLAAGVAVDKLLLELEEAVSRDEFKQELISGVKEARGEFKREIMRLEDRL